MRISESHRYWLANNRIDNAKTDNADALRVLSTQKRIGSLHDDPISAAASVKNHNRIDRNRDFQRNILFSKGFLEVSESAVNGIHDRMMRARELAVAMANDTYDPHSREATSREVKEILNEVVQLGNTSYNNRYVFSGFRTTSPALDSDGVYLGDDGGIYLEIEPNNFRRVNLPARDFFEATIDERNSGHFNMVDTIQALQDGLENSDKQLIYKTIDELDFQLQKASSMQATVGSMWNSFTEAQKRLEQAEGKEQEFLSALEDADIFKATSDFKRTETALQTTLMASNKLLQPSLMNFMQ